MSVKRKNSGTRREAGTMEDLKKDGTVAGLSRPRKITDEYLEEVAHLCAHSGIGYRQLSKEMGYAEGYLYDLRRRYPQLIEMTDNAMREKFKELSASGIEETYRLMLNAESEAVRLNAAKEILSRAGYDAVQKVENTNKEITVEFFGEEEAEDGDE